MKHIYCVVYMVDGIHYRFRCVVRNRRDAKRECMRATGISLKDIVEVINEDEERSKYD